MCPDWGRSQLQSAETSFLGKLFQKLPTMDFSARTAKASGLGREKTWEEEGWEPLTGGFPFFLCHTRLWLAEMQGKPLREQRVGKHSPLSTLFAGKSWTSIRCYFRPACPLPLHPEKPPLQQGKVSAGGDQGPAALCTLYIPPDAKTSTSHQPHTHSKARPVLPTQYPLASGPQGGSSIRRGGRQQ